MSNKSFLFCFYELKMKTIYIALFFFNWTSEYNVEMEFKTNIIFNPQVKLYNKTFIDYFCWWIWNLLTLNKYAYIYTL